MKGALIFLALLSGVAMSQAQTQDGTNVTNFRFFTEVVVNMVLQNEAQKLLITPDFPDDLEQGVLKSLSNFEDGFTNCRLVATLPWMQKRCVILQFQKSLGELRAIEEEAKARADATTTTTITTTTVAGDVADAK